eukprot:486928-Prorocentrum_minimum.AAC.3
MHIFAAPLFSSRAVKSFAHVKAAQHVQPALRSPLRRTPLRKASRPPSAQMVDGEKMRVERVRLPFGMIWQAVVSTTTISSRAAIYTSGSCADYIAVSFSTDLGTLDIELYPDQAPLSVANFLRYVDGGHYDGAVFYRVVRKDNQPQSPVPIEVIQVRGVVGSGPETTPLALAQDLVRTVRGTITERTQQRTAQGGLGPCAYDPTVPPKYPLVPHETTAASGLQHADGTISMARLDPGTATSEFFVCVGAQPSLDFGGNRNPDGQVRMEEPALRLRTRTHMSRLNYETRRVNTWVKVQLVSNHQLESMSVALSLHCARNGAPCNTICQAVTCHHGAS